MKHIVIIVDNELAYANNLTGYITEREDFPFEVRNLNKRDDIEYCIKKNRVDFILVDEFSKLEITGLLEEERIITLCRATGSDREFKRWIYKYQNCDLIISQFLLMVSETGMIGDLVNRSREANIWGFFSPVTRSGQTTLALTVSQILARRSKVLFISLEGFSALDVMLNLREELDLSDLLYSAKSSTAEISTLISGMSTNVKGVNILPPIRNYGDFQNIDEEDWHEFMELLELKTDYDYIIMDLSMANRSLFSLLDMCDKIFMMESEGMIAKRKIYKFEQCVHMNGMENFEEKIIKCNIPHIEEKNINYMQLTYGELGRYAEDMINGI